MNQFARVLLAAIMAAGLSAAARADYYEDVGDKLNRGLSNTALGWTEFFKSTYNEPAQHGMLFVPVGVMKGVANVCGRTAAGIVDLITFPVPSEPLVHSPYVWEDVNKETQYGKE